MIPQLAQRQCFSTGRCPVPAAHHIWIGFILEALRCAWSTIVTMSRFNALLEDGRMRIGWRVVVEVVGDSLHSAYMASGTDEPIGPNCNPQNPAAPARRRGFNGEADSPQMFWKRLTRWSTQFICLGEICGWPSWRVFDETEVTQCFCPGHPSQHVFHRDEAFEGQCDDSCSWLNCLDKVVESFVTSC